MSEPVPETFSDDISSQIEAFSLEEREEIIQQIDKLSSQSKISITPELLEVKPSKNGGRLPLAINIIGLLIIAGGVFFADRYFKAKEDDIVLGAGAYQSAEDSIVKELKKQAEERLKQKEQEISKIQQEMAKLDRESSNLKLTMESQIKAKEEELKAQMQRELEKERERLKNSGIASSDLEKQLKEFQAKKENDLNSALKSFKSESEAALKEKQAELEKAKALANQVLQKANADKAALEAEAKKKEAELTAQFEKEKQALTQQTNEAMKQLEELSRLQNSEHLVQDQITGSYRIIMKAIKEGDYPKAELAIGDLRKILSDPGIHNLPNIYKRVNIENFILDSLENEIKQYQTKDTTDFTTLANIAQTLINARANVEKGLSAEKKGDEYQAKRFYNAALNLVPKLQEAVTALGKIEAKELKAHAEDYISIGDASLKKGSITDALTQYRNAAVNASPVNREILSKSIQKIEDTLNLVKERLAAGAAENYKKLETAKEEALTRLQKEIDNKNREIENFGKEIKEKAAEIAGLTKELDNEKRNNENLKQQLKSLTSKNRTLTENLGEKDKEIEKLSREITQSEVKINDLSVRVKRAEKRSTELQKELDNAVDQIVDLINGP